MHSLFRKKWAAVGVVTAALLLGVATAGSAKPEPGARGRGFRLFARPLGALTVNRVYCGLATTGEVCVDSTNSSTIGGGFWPKGTADQYVFDSGLQIAGIIGNDGGAWASDTTGAFFFDPKGTTQHGQQVQPIYNTQSATDNAFICGIGSFGCDANTTDPVALAARVPSGDAGENVFFPLLRGRTAASQGDVWWLSTDANPGLIAGRPHPLGVLVEQRGMAWNYPSGNEDVVYFIYTFYNITSKNPADYAAVRPGMRDILIQQATSFQQQNEAAFGIDIPDAGYTITNMYANFAADMDVANASVNFASVNVPFALGYTYDHTFSRFAGWEFDPAIFSAPFFAGSGFVGVKYLKSPEISPGVEAGLTLFSNTINPGQAVPGSVPDPANTTALYRYISGNQSPAAGDAPCNFNPITTHICYVNGTQETDMRFFQSSGPLNLGPGEFGSVVVAYIFAAPVLTGGSAACPACDITPGSPAIIAGLTNPAIVAAGVNPIDSITGFISAADSNGDGVLQQSEFTVVPRSLLGKASVAQAVFDKGFLLPFAPDPPDFFLIPGDNQVTVMWRPTPAEVNGDPFFAVASQPLNVDNTVNVLYDPNYRQFDVEGYRVYRGRVDAPNSLRLLAQFDYAGTVITDFAGQVGSPALDPLCAPELGVTANCAVAFDPVSPGTPRTVGVDVPLVGQIIQVKLGERTLLADSTAIVLIADTLLTAHGTSGTCAPSICTPLVDNGVPFTYVDHQVRNNFRYFYSVTAFDVNSFQSGPSSLESPRITKSVTPVRPASNYESIGRISTHIMGRGVPMDSVIPAVPTINASGQFSGPFPPADAATLQFVGQFVTSIVSQGGQVALRLDGISLGDARNGVPLQYQFTALSPLDTFSFNVTGDASTGNNIVAVQGAPFAAASVDPSLASRFGITGIGSLSAQAAVQFANYQRTNAPGRGCFEAIIPGSPNCFYQGPRWFAGPNETKVDPNFDENATGNPPLTVGNAGELPGVALIFTPISNSSVDNAWRAGEAALVAAVRAADFNVYWGNPGKIDSVIDVTHNVVVDLVADSMAGGFGILNVSNTSGAGSVDTRPSVLTLNDFSCVEPFRSGAAGTGIRAQGQWGTPTCAAPYVMTDSAELNSIAIASGPLNAVNAAAPRPNPGFVMYLAGQMFAFELSGSVLPSNTVWTLRNFTGSLSGGNGAGGNIGPYSYRPLIPRQFSAVGAQVQITFDVTNRVNPPTDNDLAKVHTVPDPYYVTSQFEQTTDTKIIKFVNLPQDAIIRIYSSSGVLVRLLEHHSTTFGGDETWDVRNRNNQIVASGVYFYHVEAGNARRIGRFTVVNFAR